jgi:hypothetical protein
VAGAGFTASNTNLLYSMTAIRNITGTGVFENCYFSWRGATNGLPLNPPGQPSAGNTNIVYSFYDELGNYYVGKDTTTNAWGYSKQMGHGIIQTIFVLAQIYTNTYGFPINVSGKVSLGLAAVAGLGDMALRCNAAPANGGWTNDFAISTLVTTLAMNYTNTLSIYVPTNAQWTFTNLSTGTGNVGNVIGGQISY